MAALAARASGALLAQVDAVWLLGPHPLASPSRALAALRGKRVILGVRQDLPAYARSRHPGKRLVHLAGDLLEGAYRLLARRAPTVVVGPDLAAQLPRAPGACCRSRCRWCATPTSPTPREAAGRAWNGELTVLSVGRLETEKNPLLLADVLARPAQEQPAGPTGAS